VKDLNSDSLRFSDSRRTFRNCRPVLTSLGSAPKQNSFVPTEGCWLAHTLFSLDKLQFMEHS
jgi:hypothetical protein